LGTGTSASTALVSGVAALVLSVNPNLTAQQLEDILEQSADDFGEPGWDIYYGWGRVNAARAVQMAAGVSAPPVDTTVPVVSITSPASGTTVSGNVVVQVAASDNVGVASVSLAAGSTTLGTDTTAPYEFYWDTSRWRWAPAF
jgi:subtilisin family serine protease